MEQQTDTHLRGRNAAMQGYSIQPPSDLRSQAHKAEYEAGWLQGNRERQAMLQGKPSVHVAHRSAHPCIRRQADHTWAVRWSDPGSGREYTSAELARAGLQERVANDARLDNLLATLKPLRA